MKTIKLSTASKTLAEYAADLSDDIIVLTDHKKPVAAIVPLRGVDRASILLSGHSALLKIIRRSRAEFRCGRTISLGDMKAALAGRSPNQRFQPTKARRRPAKQGRRSARLRG